jgi:hypothetical protein
MERLIRIYRFFNLLSIDVVLGAVCSALFFAHIFNVSIHPQGLLSLALTVWIVYTTDHLLDARKVIGNASTDRHQFHQRNYRILVPCVVVAVLADALIVFFIRRPVLEGGVVLIAGVAVYLLVQQYTKIFKEIFIAVMYTLGVLLPSVMVTRVPCHTWPWVLLVQFFLLALTNLLLFSWFDHERDARDKRSSFVTIVGPARTRSIISLLFIVTALLTVFSHELKASGYLLAADSFLLCIFLWPDFFRKTDRFRLVGDAIFFILLAYTLH